MNRYRLNVWATANGGAPAASRQRFHGAWLRDNRRRRKMSLQSAGLLVLLATAMSASANGGTRSTGDSYSDIYSIDVNGSNQRNLTRTKGVGEELVSRSPDGTRLAFYRGGSVYVVRIDGSSIRKIAQGQPPIGFESAPVWFRDSRRLVFSAASRCGAYIYCERTDLKVANLATHKVRRIAQSAAEPALSADGRWLAYTRARLFLGGREPRYSVSVVVARSDGSHPHVLVRDSSGPSWASTGSYLAYLHRGSVYSVRRDGAKKQRLTSGKVFDHVWWSPHGARLALTGGYTDVYVVNASGRGLRRLGAANPQTEIVSWSPDGNSLVWPLGKRLVLSAADGRSRHELRVHSLTGVSSPVWTKDATRIFFAGAAR
jgi:Tol biopolymer transport system component